MQKCAKILLLVIFTSLYSCEVPNTDNYDLNTVFDKEIQTTDRFLQENKWIADTLSTFDVQAELAISIVYPELLFYAGGADKAEILMLKLLYAPFGEDLADFSIGTFQMKPSFARKVENYWMEYFGDEYLKENNITLEDTKEQRKARIARISSFEGSIKYLGMFTKIIEAKYPQAKELDLETKVEFYATAYNSSFVVPFEEILRRSKFKYFKTAVFPITTNKIYSYSRFSLLGLERVNNIWQ